MLVFSSNDHRIKAFPRSKERWIEYEGHVFFCIIHSSFLLISCFHEVAQQCLISQVGSSRYCPTAVQAGSHFTNSHLKFQPNREEGGIFAGLDILFKYPGVQFLTSRSPNLFQPHIFWSGSKMCPKYGESVCCSVSWWILLIRILVMWVLFIYDISMSLARCVVEARSLERVADLGGQSTTSTRDTALTVGGDGLNLMAQ